ncbi:MAG: IS1634 family transposase [Candidatus Zixiibacteriota bacterium]
MERLEAKKIYGKTYYYYSKWAWVNNRCRRVWQKYLGKLEDIAKAVEGGGPAPLYAEVFQWGLALALWRECRRAEVIERTDQKCPKREQGMSTGEYIAIAAINRAMCPKSKRSMWEWFSQTVLLRYLSRASKSALSSQRFWDHMDRIGAEAAASIWESILKGVIKRENIDLSSISYDGTNYYTFIDTFNVRCKIAKRGKNKQGRCNLRQISYALFCSSDGFMPLYYDVYEGNRNDAKEFPLVLKKFHAFLCKIGDKKCPPPNTTLIFDKGNNSADNFALIDSLKLNFVGSVKLDEHKELAQVSNNDPRFVTCSPASLEGTKAFRVKKKVYGKERIVLVTFNQNLYDTQWLTLQNDIKTALEKLSLLRQKLEDRVNGIITRGKTPTQESVERQCKAILSRQHLKSIVTTETTGGPRNIPRLEYHLDADALAKLADTYLGKNIILTSREHWDDVAIILAYRSQFIIEEIFKESKDRRIGTWWPMYHWTDLKIMVHGLYCSIALLLRALAHRRAKQAGLSLSMGRFFSALDGIREVVNIYPRKRRQKEHRKQSVLTRLSELQARLVKVLGLNKEEMVTTQVRRKPGCAQLDSGLRGVPKR